MTTCFGYPFWNPIGSGLKQIWNPFWDPKLVQNLLIFGSNFGSLFLGFWISLGASWELSWASWVSLGRPQEWKNGDTPTRKPLFYKCSFLAFWSSWWPSWAHLGPLGPIWSQNGPQNGSHKGSKKWTKKWSQKWPKTGTASFTPSPIWFWTNDQKNRSDRNCSGPKWSKKLLTSKMFPRWLQDCPR